MRRSYDDAVGSSEIHASSLTCEHRHICVCGQRARVPEANSTPQSISAGGELADASQGYEWRQVGELIRADIDPKGDIWVFHRCFNTEPAGAATCVGRS